MKESLSALSDFWPPLSIVLNQAELTFSPDQQPQQKVVQQELGWRSNAKNGLYVLQSRVDGFFFSRLFPYTTWEEFLSQGRRATRTIFQEIYAQVEIKAVVVRYINELVFPSLESIEDYVKFYVFLPPELPQYMNNMFSRVELQDAPQSDITVVINSGLLPPNNAAESRLLLDIEIKRKVNINGQDIMWNAIDSLREIKNRIFFSCLTEKMEAKLT